MFRLPSWVSEARSYDKVVDEMADFKVSPPIDTMEIPLPIATAKRRRDASGQAQDLALEEDTREAKRWKSASPPKTESPGVKPILDEKPSTMDDTSQVYEVIESQFSLEILLKHNELRLINQELAKCQVALEQLRRCHLIPYPTSQKSFQSMLQISSGDGSALQQRPGAPIPQWAPPYGVADGPYTRHYARWLIPDPSFDGERVECYSGYENSRAGKSLPEGRTTRHSFAEGSTPASKGGRSQRGTGLQRPGVLQALPAGYPQPKEKAGPCTLKRGDGRTVKLVCLDCQRENFSSTQGFINHCRIAHRRDFKSHEEAAVASGQPIEVDEMGGIIDEEKAPAIATGLVHPLIRSTSANKEAYRSLLSHIKASMALYTAGKLPGVTSIPGACDNAAQKLAGFPHSESFVPSLETPHLSALLRSKGFDSNLDVIVGDAKKTIDLADFSSPEDESEDSDQPSPQPQRRPGCLDGGIDASLPTLRFPTRATMSPAPYARPGSAKGVSGISPRPSYATPVINTAAASYNKVSGIHRELDAIHDDIDHDTIEMNGPSIVDLSPNTVSSNNAPSLVSDDGDYDEAASASEGEHDEDSDVAEIDIEDGDLEKVVSRTVGSGSKKGDKHVTFVGSVKENERTRK